MRALPLTRLAVVDAWKTYLDFGHLSCSNSQRPHTFTLSIGNSLSGCFFLHLGNNTQSTRYSSTCFYFSLMTFNCKDMELIMSVLRFLRRLLISSREAPPLPNLCAREKTFWSHVLVLEDPLEYHWHKSTMWSKGSLDMSPFPNKLSISRQYSLIPHSKMILRTSLPIVVWPDRYTLYRSISTKYSKP